MHNQFTLVNQPMTILRKTSDKNQEASSRDVLDLWLELVSCWFTDHGLCGVVYGWGPSVVDLLTIVPMEWFMAGVGQLLINWQWSLWSDLWLNSVSCWFTDNGHCGVVYGWSPSVVDLLTMVPVEWFIAGFRQLLIYWQWSLWSGL